MINVINKRMRKMRNSRSDDMTMRSEIERRKRRIERRIEPERSMIVERNANNRRKRRKRSGTRFLSKETNRTRL